MFTDILNILLAGFIAGFIFSMPVAGPISILITSRALEGKLKFCQRTALGASVVEFLYVFIVIIGIKSLYTYYKPFIPYIILVGAIFLFLVSIKIIRSKVNLSDVESKSSNNEKDNGNGGFRTGLILNLTNPSLFIGWLASSFLVFSFMAQIGLSTGGLDLIVSENISSVSHIAGDTFDDLNELGKKIPKENINNEETSISTLILALIYSVAVGLGGFLWLFLFSKILVKHRHRLNVNIINYIIKTLGVVLLFIAFFLSYKAILML